jgi:putative endonuclease
VPIWPLRSLRPVSFGRKAEILGALHLRTLGYQLLASPYVGPSGEIDIVARDGECLVFVEVKARRRDPHPEDAVTGPKRRRIIRAAAAYRQRYGQTDRPYRFDVLAVIDPSGSRPRYRLFRDAFRDSSREARPMEQRVDAPR